jgi:hypothetical protein
MSVTNDLAENARKMTHDHFKSYDARNDLKDRLYDWDFRMEVIACYNGGPTVSTFVLQKGGHPPHVAVRFGTTGTIALPFKS